MAILTSKKDKKNKNTTKKGISFRDRLTSSKSGAKNKIDNISQWKNATIAELSKYNYDMKKELQEIRFQIAVGTVPNVRKVRVLKKNIARVLTIKRMKELDSSLSDGN